MKSIKKIRLSIATALAAVGIASLAVGVAVHPISADAENTVVNGWNSAVTRGASTVDLGTAAQNGFAKYENLQEGDVITYNGKLSSLQNPLLPRTQPYRISMSAKGEGTVSWAVKTEKPDGGLAIYYGATYTIGGNAIDAPIGFNSVKQKTVAAGETLDMIIGGHSIYGGDSLYYVDANGGITPAATIHNDGGFFYSGEVQELDLTVTVTGNVSELQVKAGESLMLTKINEDWTWEGYNPPFKAMNAQDAFKGVLSPVLPGGFFPSYWVFKGYDFSFRFATDQAGAVPYVTVGGNRVDSDGTAAPDCGWYNYTVPSDATTANVEITAADLSVSFMDGEEVLLKNSCNFGEKASVPQSVEKNGKVVEGWYADKELTQAFDFENTPINADTNIYVKWKAVPSLTFMADGQEHAYENFEEPGVPTLPQAPQKEGMGFIGWYTEENGATAFDFTQQITANTTAYAVFGYNVTYRLLGFDMPDGSQYKNIVVKEGAAVAAEDLPDYATITGRLPYDAFEIEWYTNAEMTEKATFPYTPSASVSLYGCLVDTKDYFKYVSEYGWDMASAVRNQETLVDGKEVPLTESEYGAMDKIADGENGYSSMRLNYEGYIVNTRKLDVTKDIYFDISIDTTCDDTNYAQAPAGTAKWFMFGLFNSLNAALTSEGPNSHRGGFGVLGLFGFNLVQNTTALSGNDWTKSVRPVPDAFHFTGGKKLDLTHFVIVIGETKAESGIYVVGEDGTRTLAASLDLQRSMFPNGLYFMASCFRMSDITIRLTQESSVTVGSQEKGTYSLSRTTGLAGEKVYLENIAPKAGYSFTTKGVYANGKALSVESEKVGEETKYYFALPFGEDIAVEIRWAVKVTFMADGQEVGTATVVPGNKVLNKDMPDDPVKTGYKFEGWYKDAAFTQTYTRDTDLIEDVITIYAKFTAETYTITFISDGETHSSATAAYGEKFTAAEIAKEGYTFGGWYTDEVFTTAYDFNAAVSGNVTVYAKWTQTGGGSTSDSQTSENDSDSDSQTSGGGSQSNPGTVSGCKGGCTGVAGWGGLVAGLTLAGAALVLAVRKKSE